MTKITAKGLTEERRKGSGYIGETVTETTK